MGVSILEDAPLRDLQAGTRGASVRLQGVTKAFGQQTVLHGIDLEIPAGQFVAIVGRSGCGKSTLLRLLAGLDKPTGGRIEVGGHDSGRHDPGRHDPGRHDPGRHDHVRLMFQEPRLLPWQRIVANVEVGLSHLRGGENRRREAIEAIAQVGLAGREKEWPAVLSGGQKQRVALARALVSHPRILAFDEPLGALDALTRIEMQALIEQVWEDKGFTAIVVTHDVTEAVALADRILVLDGGRVAMDVAVHLPRPRRRGDPAAAAIEGRILDRLLGR
jgi:sulfonate transport system ATP-binding protein